MGRQRRGTMYSELVEERDSGTEKFGREGSGVVWMSEKVGKCYGGKVG
jgi:hypothetical protein